jgi:hypothetical protein
VEQLLLDVGKLSRTLQFAKAARTGMSTTHPKAPDPKDEYPDKQILRKRKVCMIRFYLVCVKYNPTAEFQTTWEFFFFLLCKPTRRRKKPDIERFKVSNYGGLN